jgi:hypothetical protein
MRKPKPRTEIPPRSSENKKRKLFEVMDTESLKTVFASMRYEGSPKHKRNPHLFGLEPYHGERGDETLCDEHAGFVPSDFGRIPRLLDRAQGASLVGNFIWTVDDNGWIYELTVTNIGLNQHHGYPLRPSEAIAEKVYCRFRTWAMQHGSPADLTAADACQSFYGFRS